MNDVPRDFRILASRSALFLMAIGLTIYASFRIVQNGWLAVAGLVWIGVGCVATLVGLALLSDSPRPRVRPCLLLLANFPVAALCVLSAIDVIRRVEVYVRNDSRETMTDVRLVLRDAAEEDVVTGLPDLPPGRRAARALRPEDHAELWLEYRTGAEERRVSVSGYVSGNGAGEYLDVRVNRGNAATVRTSRPTFLWPVLP